MSRVEHFYDAQAEYEWHRLERHPMEFATTMRMLAEYLPAPPARILDVGGGPGRYSLALARQGYRVTLFDLSAGCLSYARHRAAEARLTLDRFVHGNALDLSAFADSSFDAVMLMGPMYHLTTAADRARSLQEARRVLRPGGVLGVAFINRYATILSQSPHWVTGHLAGVREELADGLRRDRDRFPDSFSLHPREVAPLLAEHGFDYGDMVAVEGIGIHKEAEAAGLTEAEWQSWVDLNFQVARDPALLGAAIHLFAVAAKP